MRKVVLAMMTTLNGRLDDPAAWMTGLSDDQYQEIADGYAAFDTVLVGRVTYAEMAEDWPKALDDPNAGETHRAMGRMMNDYKKFVVTGSPQDKLEWNNSEAAVVTNDDELRTFVEGLKAQPGKDIHLSGGAKLAESMIRLGLVDEYRLFVYPVVSPGSTWLEPLTGRQLEPLAAKPFESGVVALYYRPRA